MNGTISISLNNIEDSDDTVTSSGRNHVARLAELDGEVGARETADLRDGLVLFRGIEDLDLVGARATSDNQTGLVLHELCLVDHARLLGGQTIIPIDTLEQLAGREIPKLQLVLLSVGTSQNEALMQVNGVTANERAVH